MSIPARFGEIADAIREKTGSEDLMTPWEMPDLIRSISGGGGGLPDGIKSFNFGTYVFDADMAGSNSPGTNVKIIQHGLSEAPDLILFYSPTVVGETYSMLATLYVAKPWVTSYTSYSWYHGNSTTAVTGGGSVKTCGIFSVSGTSFYLKTFSTSTSYYWRAGTYKWIAIKFS